MQSPYQVADVLKQAGESVNLLNLNTWKLRTLSAIRKCRTAELGGHIDTCSDCGVMRISYNSCRNRHCPKCQGHKREEWINARIEDLLPVAYFHVVFTLPEPINPIALKEPKLLYDTLFAAAWKTMEVFAKNKGVLPGMIALLHTWGQNLSLHPHLHCIVPGGGIELKGRWKNIRADGKFLFPVKALSKVFRAKFVSELNTKIKLERALRNELFKNSWVVYAKRPFGTPASVIEYLGRYSHKIAISNHRIKNIDKSSVSFSYKDYRQMGAKKLMTLSHLEFVRRFSLHILPKRFVKIRHYGFLSSTWKRKKLKEVQGNFSLKPTEKKKETRFRKCPCCKKGILITLELLPKRAPPLITTSSDSQRLFPCNQ